MGRKIFCIAIVFTILLTPVTVESTVVKGGTSVRLNQVSFLNTLDKYTCNSINNPLLTRTPTHMFPIQYPPKSSPCHDSLYPYPEILEGSQIVISHRVNFYPMLRLRVGDYILSEGDTCCVGDTITVESDIIGDWFRDGGPVDCPPVVWVKPEKIEEMIDKYLQFYEFRDNWDCPLTDKSLYDPLTGIVIHRFVGIRHCSPEMYGNIVCTANPQTNTMGNKIIVQEGGLMEINMNYTPQCMLLNPKGHVTSHEWGTPPGLGLREHYRVFVKPVEWGYIPGDLSGLSYYKNEEIPWLDYIAGATEIKLTSHVNAIGVVERPKLEVMESTIGGNPGGYVIRAVIKNTGDGKALVDEVTLNLKSYKILYKPDELDGGEESDIIIETDPGSLSFLTEPLQVTINYRAEKLGCQKTREFTATFELDIVEILDPHRSSQVYMMDVAGGCVNQYYSCYSPDKGGILAAGYECFNQEPYFIPTRERFDLGFDLSSISEGKDIAYVMVTLSVGGVNRGQDLTVYSSDNDDWTPASCEAKKDLCGPTYCKKECSQLFDLGVNPEDSVHVDSAGLYSLDVTGFIKSQYLGDKYATFQIRGSEEDRFKSEGESSCTAPKKWDLYDIRISGKPHLTVIYN